MLDNASGPGGFDAEPWMWFEITPDNQIRLYVSKVEMGQGIHTALAQIGAEELGLELSQLELRQATTHVGPADGMGTAGSSSVTSVYDPLRQAAATLREMLRAEAATALGVPADQLVLDGASFAVAGDASKRMTFGEIVAHHQQRAGDEWDTVEGAPLKSADEFTVIGQSAPRIDIPAKVTGAAGYGYDMRMDGMAYGAVWRSATLEGKLTSAAAGDATAVDGVEQVVIQDGFAGVVASSRAAAHDAVGRLEVAWDEGKRWQQAELDELITVGNGNGVVIQKEGNAPRLLGEETTIKAEYRSPLAAHSSMETQAALAHVTAD
ncbi:MAG: molybdopterin cofactor-binding domain-containing protein [Caldilineaceae bacterium]